MTTTTTSPPAAKAGVRPATAPTRTGDVAREPWAVTWFKRAMWLGIIANCIIAVPGIFIPNTVLATLHWPLVFEKPIWTAAASMLLTLLSIFYIPAAIDPFRYRAIAWLSVFLARVAGPSFFLVLWPNQYPGVGYLDLTFFVIEAPLLLLAMRQGPTVETRGS
jgi:hypothetical protein